MEFVKDKEMYYMEENIKNDSLIEYTEYCGNYYGTINSKVQKLLEKKNVILEIEVQGYKQVKEKMPEAVSIFITPPSLEELERRLRNRGTDSEETILKRFFQNIPTEHTCGNRAYNEISRPFLRL